ncbi:hypothetical protein Halar_3333 [halophilic archaeon DL31]|nr:hypothetical protein Halar_3333 [halophilic archaeon DL31]
MSQTRLFVTVSLLVLTLVSVGVVAEAEHNYATVTDRDDSTAAVSEVVLDEGLEMSIRVHNSMNRPLRVQYVTVNLAHDEGNGGSSTPYNGRRTVAPGTETLVITVPERMTGGSLSEGDSVTVSGTVVVEVYNDFRFEIPIELAEVRL